VGREVIGPLAEYYFRLKVLGLEKLAPPEAGRATIFVANHAGRCLPWDAILLDYAIGQHWLDHFGIDISHKPRSLAALEISDHPLLVPFRMVNWWRKVGCLDATARNFQRLVRSGQSVIVFPEGIAGIARDFGERYQLLPFSDAVVRIASRYKAQIIPVSIVGSEYFHPYAHRAGWTDALAKYLKLPFLYVSPFQWLPLLFPWAFYIALPAPVTIVIGEPYELVEPEIEGQMGNSNESWQEATQKLRAECQQQLNQARALYEKGWDWSGLLRSLLAAPEPLWKLLPFAWPHRFVNHARQKAAHLFPELPSPWWFHIPLLGLFKPKEREVHPEKEYTQGQLPQPLASLPG